MIFLGIDSSNYRSSVAFVKEDNTYLSHRRYLPVPEGKKGLRQSDAVFAHVKQLPTVLREVLQQVDPSSIRCIGVSDRPRRLPESYMPCFLVGYSLATTLSSVLRVPMFCFSHQEGHIAAALLSANALHLKEKPFVAFHVSGGTTEVLYVQPATVGFSVEIIGKTLDLNLGQVIDRSGALLGISFPFGPMLEEMAKQGSVTHPIRVCLKGMDCALSGMENKCQELLQKGEQKENIAAYILHSAAELLVQMTKKVRLKYGDIPILYTGGVMADDIIKDRLKTEPNTYFALPELTGDNAVGTALLAHYALGE